MKMNKQMMKKLNSPKTFFIFIFFVIIALIVLHFVFQSIRVIFDMDKKADKKMDTAKLSVDSKPSTNSN
jgi:uncharacterized membrane protein